jgi:hypothetical protein
MPTVDLLSAKCSTPSLFHPCNRSLQPPRDRNWSPYWPADHFRTLADRSRFANHLIRFQIHAIVKYSDLLRCLEVLPGLEELFISDSVLPEELVITDLLLQGLAYVPRLHDTYPQAPFLETRIRSWTHRHCIWPPLRPAYKHAQIAASTANTRPFRRIFGGLWTASATCRPKRWRD